MIGIVDYNAGNTRSVSNALAQIGVECFITAEAELLSRCDGIILPGVGAAPGVMASLRTSGLDAFLPSTRIPVLGICLGMQVLFESSDEGDVRCLGIIPGQVKSLAGMTEKIPHMGWNSVVFQPEFPIARGLSRSPFFYFAHSYYLPILTSTRAVMNDGPAMSAAVHQDNFFGVQFHPEKSGNEGLTLLENFCGLCASSRR